MLKRGNCVKEDTGNAVLTLEADTGESFLIKQIYVFPNTAAGYITLRVGRNTVGVYRIAGKTGNHLGYPTHGVIHRNLMEYLAEQNINVAIPVAEGQEFTITKANQYDHTIVVYDIYDAADMRSDMPNGSESREFTFLQYMDASSYPSASGDVELNVSLSPAEFPDFPCGRVVPAKHTIELLGLVGSPVGDATDASNYIVSDYVKLVKGRETLFDEDRKGIPFRCSQPSQAAVQYYETLSLIHSCVSISFTETIKALGNPLIFNPPLKFDSGEELLIYITFRLIGSHTLTAAAIDLAAVMKVTVE